MGANSFFERSFIYAAPTLWNGLDLDYCLLKISNKNQDPSLPEVLCKLILIIYRFIVLREEETIY